MLPKCPEEVQRPMFAPQFQPGLCEPASRSGTRGVGYLQERMRTPADTAESRTQVKAERLSRPDISVSMAVHHLAASGHSVACLKD